MAAKKPMRDKPEINRLALLRWLNEKVEDCRIEYGELIQNGNEEDADICEMKHIAFAEVRRHVEELYE